MTTTMRHQFEKIGTGVMLGMLLAVLVAGLTAPDVSAKRTSGTTTNTKSEFVSVCRALGGTVKHISSTLVKCTFPNGDSTTCRFTTNKCRHEYGLIVQDGQANFEEAEVVNEVDESEAGQDVQPGANEPSEERSPGEDSSTVDDSQADATTATDDAAQPRQPQHGMVIDENEDQ